MSAVRSALVVLGAVVAVLLLVAQAASVALFGPLARTPSFPLAVAASWPFALASATGAERVGAVRVALARAALVRGETDRAAALLAPLPLRGDVADMRGRIALAAGRHAEAVADFGAAGDVVRALAAIDAVAANDPVAAYDLAGAFADDAARRGEPAPVQGEASWRAGELAATAALARPADALRYNRIARDRYRAAVRADPTQEAYWLANGMAALVLGDANGSRDAYARAAVVVPESIDAYVGLAVSEARRGDCAASRAALDRARALAPRQHRTVDVGHDGYNNATMAAFTRCTSHREE